MLTAGEIAIIIARHPNASVVEMLDYIRTEASIYLTTATDDEVRTDAMLDVKSGALTGSHSQ